MSFNILKKIYELMKEVKEKNLKGMGIDRYRWIERKGNKIYLKFAKYNYRRKYVNDELLKKIPFPQISFSEVERVLKRAEKK